MSPASGDVTYYDTENHSIENVSIQLMSPASGDPFTFVNNAPMVKVSIQLMSPASGDVKRAPLGDTFVMGFHSINVPSEWGLLTSLFLRSVNVSIQLMSPASGDDPNKVTLTDITLFPFN